MQKLTAQLSKGGPLRHLRKKKPEAIASFASPNIHLWMLYIE